MSYTMQWNTMYVPIGGKSLSNALVFAVKQLGRFIFKFNSIFSFCSPNMKYSCLKLAQCNRYLVSTVDTDAMVL